MFGWFAPKCPLDLSQKVWTEYRMRWLADRLGIERLLKATVVTPDFFPESHDAGEAGARAIYGRLAGLMSLDSPPELHLGADEDMPGALGLYLPGPPPRILLNERIIDDSDQVAATLAHELAHEILLGGGLIDRTAHDHELVTDLLLVYLGVGIASINTTIKDRAWREGNLEYFQISRSGYLTALDFGYALALFAYVRGEENPHWASHLRPDAAEVLRKGLRFLQSTGDTLFHPDRVREKLRPPTPAEARDTLNGGSPSHQVFMLWRLGDDPLRDPATIELIISKLGDREAAIGAAAADALAVLGDSAVGAVPALLAALRSKHSLVRAAAASALGGIQSDAGAVVPALIERLNETKSSVLAAAAFALACHGKDAAPSVTPLLHALDAALHRNPHEGSVPRLIHALLKIDPDPDTSVRAFYEEGNDEHRDHILELLRTMRGEKVDEDSHEEMEE
jgi:hypothetical protein